MYLALTKTTNGTESILTIQEYIENNDTTVQCTVSSGTNIEQSGFAQLLLYGKDIFNSNMYV